MASQVKEVVMWMPMRSVFKILPPYGGDLLLVSLRGGIYSDPGLLQATQSELRAVSADPSFPLRGERQVIEEDEERLLPATYIRAV